MAEIDAGGISGHPADPELVVKMSGRGEPGRTDEPNHLALTDPGPGPNSWRESAKVSISGAHSIAMSQLDGPAVPTGPTSQLNRAVAGGQHWRPARRGIVDTFVTPPNLKNGMETRPAETRGDPSELNRCLEKRPPER